MTEIQPIKWEFFNEDKFDQGNQLEIGAEVRKNFARILVKHGFVRRNKDTGEKYTMRSMSGQVFVFEINIYRDNSIRGEYSYNTGAVGLQNYMNFTDIEKVEKWTKHSAKRLMKKFFEEHAINDEVYANLREWRLKDLRDFINKTMDYLKEQSGLLMSKAGIEEFQEELENYRNQYFYKSKNRITIKQIDLYLRAVHPELHVLLKETSCYKDTHWQGSRLRGPRTREYTGYQLRVWRSYEDYLKDRWIGNLINHNTTHTYRTNSEVMRTVADYEKEKAKNE